MHQYDGVIVSKLDRLSRGRDWNIRAWAEQNGKKLLVVSPELCWPPKPGDTATPIVWDVVVNISAADWESTSTRICRSALTTGIAGGARHRHARLAAVRRLSRRPGESQRPSSG
jgi:hypothetical protein